MRIQNHAVNSHITSLQQIQRFPICALARRIPLRGGSPAHWRKSTETIGLLMATTKEGHASVPSIK